MPFIIIIAIIIMWEVNYNHSLGRSTDVLQCTRIFFTFFLTLPKPPNSKAQSVTSLVVSVSKFRQICVKSHGYFLWQIIIYLNLSKYHLPACVKTKCSNFTWFLKQIMLYWNNDSSGLCWNNRLLKQHVLREKSIQCK